MQKNLKGWLWSDWLKAAGLYDNLNPHDIVRYQKLTKAWEDCLNPYNYKE